MRYQFLRVLKNLFEKRVEMVLLYTGAFRYDFSAYRR